MNLNLSAVVALVSSSIDSGIILVLILIPISSIKEVIWSIPLSIVLDLFVSSKDRSHKAREKIDQFTLPALAYKHDPPMQKAPPLPMDRLLAMFVSTRLVLTTTASYRGYSRLAGCLGQDLSNLLEYLPVS